MDASAIGEPRSYERSRVSGGPVRGGEAVSVGIRKGGDGAEETEATGSAGASNEHRRGNGVVA